MSDEATRPDPDALLASIKKESDARKYREFQQALLRLAQRLEASTKPEDRERAANIRKAIELSSSKGVDTQFDHLINQIKNSKELSLNDLQLAMEQNRMLVSDIRAIQRVRCCEDGRSLVDRRRAVVLASNYYNVVASARR